MAIVNKIQKKAEKKNTNKTKQNKTKQKHEINYKIKQVHYTMTEKKQTTQNCSLTIDK